MPLPTQPYPPPTGPLVAADLQAAGQGVVAGLQMDWMDVVRKSASLYAYVETLRAEVGDQQFAALAGPGGPATLQALADRFKTLYAATRKLESGEAVIVAYRAGADPMVHMGIYKASAARGHLGAGPFVYFALAAGTVLTAGYMYVYKFAEDTRRLRAESESRSLKIAERMGAEVQRIAQTDPQAAARIQEANNKALEMARQAGDDPDAWIDKLAGAVGSGFEGLLNSPLLWLGLAFWWTQRGRA